MASNPEPSAAISVDELRSLETALLKALCLTINTAGSELKYKILDSLSDEDFYFPITKSVFRTLSELHRKGDYVISANLDEELQQAGVEVPPGFSIDDLFTGNLPALAELNGWVARLKERSRSGIVPTVRSPDTPGSPPVRREVPAAAGETQVRPVAEVKQKIAEELRKSAPAMSRPQVATPPQPRAPVPPPRSKPSVPPPSPPPREKSSPASRVAPRAKSVLASEGDDWASYLDDLAAKQGRSFETGFPRLDRELGGLGPGLVLVVDENRERLVAFLKQLTDQIASTTEVRALYLATDTDKSSLRVRTLARLASVPRDDIEKGRLKKDSREWQRVAAEGSKAAAWLKRVFVYEVEGELEIGLARELTKKLLEGSGKATAIVVIEALEKIGHHGGSTQMVASQLRALADSLEVLVLAATADPTLLASKDANYAAVFRDADNGLVELEVLQTGKEASAIFAFQHELEFCRFSEA